MYFIEFNQNFRKVYAFNSIILHYDGSVIVHGTLCLSIDPIKRSLYRDVEAAVLIR